jgi:protoporphyrinogen oxidase
MPSSAPTEPAASAQPLRVAVIGAGPMGLAAAYELAKRGVQVTVYERDDRIGGMSAFIDFAGTRIERYYHFICKPDRTTFEYLREFGLEDRLRWVSTKMGFFFRGRLYDWGHPLALLNFPGLSLSQKLRYGLHVMRAKGINDWRPYDAFSSTAWLRRWIGEDAYDVLWRSLFHFKFYEYENSLSAAWLGTRIKRVALSRRSIFEEQLGYLEGGSEVLLEVVARRIGELGGHIELMTAVEEVVITDGRRVSGVRIGGELQRYDRVISTIPLPYLMRVAPDLPADEKAKVAKIRNVAVVCVLLKLRQAFTRNFWMNINDPRIEIPGLIEYTNLNPLDGSSIVYAPYYMPQTHPKYRRSHDEFIAETLADMRLIRPDFLPERDVIASTASRYEFAQTVCSPGFYAALPPMQRKAAGLIMADTSHYYPEDRSISESMRIGAQLATLALGGDGSIPGN